MTMEARDAIVSWLEQGDNFLRVTASPFSPSTRRGRGNVREVAQAESAALAELAAFVSRSVPRTNWDAQHAKQMLKYYLMQYRSTAEAAAKPQFSLDERDKLRGLKTVQHKLDDMCRHFQRLQTLHNPVTRDWDMTVNTRQEKQSQGEAATVYVKLHFDLTETQRSARERDVVPESDLSHSCENSETDKKDDAAKGEDMRGLEEDKQAGLSREAADKELVTAVESVTLEVEKEKDASRNPVGERRGTEREVVELAEKSEDNGEEIARRSTRGSQSIKDKKDKSNRTDGAKRPKMMQHEQETTKRKGSKKKQQKKVVLKTRSVVLRGDEEKADEELRVLRRSTRAKRRSAESPERSPSGDDDDSTPIKKKLRRVTSARIDRVDVSDVALTQTTQAASSSSSDEPHDSLVNDDNTPSLNTQSHDKPSSCKKRKPVLKVASISATTQPVSSSFATQERRKGYPASSAAVQSSAALSSASSNGHNQESAPSSVRPVAYRSRIAEAISQRQQLMSRTSRMTDHDSQDEPSYQRSLSDSDYGLSDIDLPTMNPKPIVPRNGQRNIKPSEIPCSAPGPSAGLLPPLIDGFGTALGNSKLERKRVFFRAKVLAFEQLKWHRENEVQQRELELLRRELEAREALALQELELKRMSIRVELIQPMISAGASFADIAERLRLL